MNFLQKHKKFVITFISIFFWITFLLIIDPSEIVNFIGVKNGYVVIFLVAALGGVSSFTGASFYATLITLASGGLNPFALAIISGFGLLIGDSLFYYLGFRGKKVVGSKKLDKVSRWLKKDPSWLVQIGIYVYAGFTPLPNDFMTVSLGLTKYPYKKVMIPLLMGDITSSLLVALFVSQEGIF